MISRPSSFLVTVFLDEAGGKTVLNETILYSSEQERDRDFASVASSAAEIFTKLELYLLSLK